MLADPQNIKPGDEAPALPLLVMTSSLLDLTLRPTTSPVSVSSIYIVEEALATFLAMSLGDQFAGREGSARLVEIDVIVKALRYDGLSGGRGRRLTEDGFSNIPSTILTTTVRAKLRGKQDSIIFFDNLIFGAFLNASDGGRLEDLLASSAHPVISSVTDTEISLTSFAAFATGQASFAPSLPGTGAAVIDGNDITPGIVYSGAKGQPSSPSNNGSAFDKNDPMDVAFVSMSGLIFFAMIILIYLHRVKDKGGSHEERIRHFFPGGDRSRASADAVYNDSSSDEGPINRASFASDGSGMLEGRTVEPMILPSTAPLPTLAKYHYPVPKLRPRPQTLVNRNTSPPILNSHAPSGLNPIPEDQAFSSPGYFDPENLRRSDSSLSSDVFAVDVVSAMDEDIDPSGLPTDDDGRDITIQRKDASSSTWRWNQWQQQVMVVNSGNRRDVRVVNAIGGGSDAEEYDADLEGINIGNISKSYSSDSGNDGDGVSQLSTGYSC